MATIKGIAIPALKQLAYKLAEQTGKNVEEWVKALINSQSLLISQPTQDSIWISELNGTWGMWNGLLMSAYFHSTKNHSTTTHGKLGNKKSYAKAGEWAVSIQTKGLYGNKTFYSTK